MSFPFENEFSRIFPRFSNAGKILRSFQQAEFSTIEIARKSEENEKNWKIEEDLTEGWSFIIEENRIAIRLFRLH